MLTPEERLKIGLQILKELGPKIGLNRNPAGSSLRANKTAPNAQPDEDQTGTHSMRQDALPSLQILLAHTSPLAPDSLILGACQDGPPLSLELDNPAPGAILIGGDPGCGKTRLLKSALASIAIINTPEQVNYYIIARDPTEYQELDLDHCQALVATSDPAASALIQELAQAVEDRRAAPSQGPALVLILDDLASLVQQLDRQTFSRLYGLVRHGPRARIWPLAGVSSSTANEIDPRLLAAFRSRLIGSTVDKPGAELLAGNPAPPVDQLTPGNMFCTLMGSEWLFLWICDPEPFASDSEIGGDS